VSDFMISVPMRFRDFQIKDFESGIARGEMLLPLRHIIESVAGDVQRSIAEGDGKNANEFLTQVNQLLKPYHLKLVQETEDK
jgi:hypothetical protein